MRRPAQSPPHSDPRLVGCRQWALALLTLPLACSEPAIVPQDGVPLLPQFDVESDIRMTGLLFGRLAVRSGCLMILPPKRQNDAGAAGVIPIWPKEASVGRDAQGVYVRDDISGIVIRPGDRISGGGGFIASSTPPPKDGGLGRTASPAAGDEVVRDRAWLNRQITPNLPASCAGDYATFYDFRLTPKGDPY